MTCCDYEGSNLGLSLYNNAFDLATCDQWYLRLMQETEWQQGSIKLFGKTIAEPRLTHWYADMDVDYTYSGRSLKGNGWPDLMLEIKERVEAITQAKFNSVLLNLYRDGQDSMGWHQDNEKSLGQNPSIASLSLGETRIFKLKHIIEPDQKIDIDLKHGALLYMHGGTQHFWKHQISKTKKVKSERINLTFRKI